MSNNRRQISPVAPSKWVMNALGAIGGGYSGYVKARDAAEASGEKMTFANSAAAIGGEALMGGIMPMKGITGAATTGLGEYSKHQADKQAEQDAVVAESTPGAAPGTTPTATPPVDVQSQNSSVDPNAVFPSPNSARVGQVFDPTQDTYGSMFAL